MNCDSRSAALGTNQVNLNCRKIQVKCLQSVESLREACEKEEIKFNDCGKICLWLMNCDSCTATLGTNQVDPNCREFQVKCLQSVESLKEACEKEGLKFNDCDAAYEVDMIFADKVIDDEKHYYVKWKNYSTSFNTWEPLSNLTGCREMIKYYHAMKWSKVKVSENILSYFIRDLVTRRPYDLLTMTKVCALCFETSEKYVTSLKLTMSQMKTKIREILFLSPKRLSRLKPELFNLMQYGEERKHILIDLKEWEDKINCDLPNKAAYVKVENHVDLETAPNNFEFIHDYVSSVITKREEPLVFCKCNNCFKEKNACCPRDSEGIFAYNKFKRLILKPGYPIFECSNKCHCSMDCPNRVVQHGQKVKVSIFRTSNGTGWGLKTLENIDEGQFLLEYLGEIITSETAEARGRIYDYVARSYLFDLDYGVENACYTIDARHLGNAARFINHSCDPNLIVFAVWINEEDPHLPRLAFFAKRRIPKGEELTFDYKMQKEYTDVGDTSMNERVVCRCKAKNCRKYLF